MALWRAGVRLGVPSTATFRHQRAFVLPDIASAPCLTFTPQLPHDALNLSDDLIPRPGRPEAVLKNLWTGLDRCCPSRPNRIVSDTGLPICRREQAVMGGNKAIGLIHYLLQRDHKISVVWACMNTPKRHRMGCLHAVFRGGGEEPQPQASKRERPPSGEVNGWVRLVAVRGATFVLADKSRMINCV